MNHSEARAGDQPRGVQAVLDAIAFAWDTSKGEQDIVFSAACPHCGAMAAFQRWNSCGWKGSVADGARPRVLLEYGCPACLRSLVVVSSYQTVEGKVQLALHLLWPRSVRPSVAPADLESQLREDYDEARTILDDSPKAAAVLARRCLQGLLRLKLGVSASKLHTAIEAARKDDRLARPTRDAMHHVRLIGNDGAHPAKDGGCRAPDSKDDAEVVFPVTHADAEYTLEVVELLFHDLYELPSRIAAMDRRLKREPKRDGTPGN